MCSLIILQCLEVLDGLVPLSAYEKLSLKEESTLFKDTPQEITKPSFKQNSRNLSWSSVHGPSLPRAREPSSLKNMGALSLPRAREPSSLTNMGPSSLKKVGALLLGSLPQQGLLE